MSKTELVDRIKAILQSRALTLYQCSQKTITVYGRRSPYFLPHNLYHDLSIDTFSLSLHQLFALSRVSGYKFHDWLRVFGFNPEDIVRLQVLLSSKRTLLIDSSLDDPECWIPWFRNKPGGIRVPPIAPIGRLLELAPSQRIGSITRTQRDNFLYAKIGREDAFAFPDLLPGSIVRADTRVTKEKLYAGHSANSKPLFLIQHSNGVCCCRLQAVGRDRVIPLCGQLPYAPVELEFLEEVRVLGILDLEIRPMLRPEHPDVPAELAKQWRPLALKRNDTKLSQLLRTARLRMGLSFREASAMTLRVAGELGNEQFFAAPGSLSDYEARDIPPRHVHKAITLCAIYGLHLSKVLKSIGLRLEDAGSDPIPDGFMPRAVRTGPRGSANETDSPPENGFLGQLLKRSGHLPLFLRRSLSDLSGLRDLSIHDLFWIGGESNPLHPVLVNGMVAIVNRHRKKPIYFRSKPLWQQPVYVLLKRDGTYTCGCCSLEDGMLVIHPYSSTYHRPEQLRNHDDAEVVGQINVVARRL